MSVERNTIRFTEIYENLPDLMGLPKGKNLSVHSCFVTVLHLANEKGLKFLKYGEDFLIQSELSF